MFLKIAHDPNLPVTDECLRRNSDISASVSFAKNVRPHERHSGSVELAKLATSFPFFSERAYTR